MKRTIVYLYSEVMPYTIAVMRALHQKYGVDIHCIYWDVKKNTPFIPANEEGIFFYKRSLFDRNGLISFVKQHAPLLVYVSGRMDKEYLDTALRFKGKIPIVSGFDDQWHSNAKNRLKALLGYFLYKRYFDYLWVAGARQAEFARRIGYKDSHIKRSVYCADTVDFLRAYKEKTAQRSRYPHTIVFVGRFVKQKGIDLLIEAFTQIKQDTPNDWKLVLVGTGNFEHGRALHPDIEVRDFMSTSELATNSKEWGVFCLPSTYEPWGVVVHESAAAGLPLICSDSVGAADTFLKDGYNGFLFRNGDVASLKAALEKVIALNDNKLWGMCEKSNEMAVAITPGKSADSLMSIFPQNMAR